MRRNECGVSPRVQKPVGSPHFGHCKWNLLYSVGRKNASTMAAPILGLPATKGLGFIGDGWRIRTWFSMRKPMQSPRGGFLWTSRRGRRGFRPSDILPLRPSSLLLKLERGGLWFDGSLGITVALWPGCVYRAVVHSNFCIWHVDPVADAPHISERK